MIGILVVLIVKLRDAMLIFKKRDLSNSTINCFVQFIIIKNYHEKKENLFVKSHGFKNNLNFFGQTPKFRALVIFIFGKGGTH